MTYERIKYLIEWLAKDWGKIEFGLGTGKDEFGERFKYSVDILGPGQGKSYVFEGNDLFEILDKLPTIDYKKLDGEQNLPGYYNNWHEQAYTKLKSENEQLKERINFLLDSINKISE